MSYRVNTKGSQRFRSVDLVCSKCGSEDDRFIEVALGDSELLCKICGTKMDEVWRQAPTSRVGGEGSDRQIESMKKSFQQRFYKKELDDVRHKHGSDFVDAQVSAAAERIKSNQQVEE